MARRYSIPDGSHIAFFVGYAINQAPRRVLLCVCRSTALATRTTGQTGELFQFSGDPLTELINQKE